MNVKEIFYIYKIVKKMSEIEKLKEDFFINMGILLNKLNEKSIQHNEVERVLIIYDIYKNFDKNIDKLTSIENHKKIANLKMTIIKKNISLKKDIENFIEKQNNINNNHISNGKGIDIKNIETGKKLYMLVEKIDYTLRNHYYKDLGIFITNSGNFI